MNALIFFCFYFVDEQIWSQIWRWFTRACLLLPLPSSPLFVLLLHTWSFQVPRSGKGLKHNFSHSFVEKTARNGGRQQKACNAQQRPNHMPRSGNSVLSPPVLQRYPHHRGNRQMGREIGRKPCWGLVLHNLSFFPQTISPRRQRKCAFTASCLLLRRWTTSSTILYCNTLMRFVCCCLLFVVFVVCFNGFVCCLLFCLFVLFVVCFVFVFVCFVCFVCVLFCFVCLFVCSFVISWKKVVCFLLLWSLYHGWFVYVFVFVAGRPVNTHPYKIFTLPPRLGIVSLQQTHQTACEHLALSTNAIDKMQPLPGLRNLKILSLGTCSSVLFITTAQ